MPKKQKESHAVDALRRYMQDRGWVTKKMHGSALQAGFPDLFCVHPEFSYRLVEVKMSWGRLTDAQRREFHRLSAGGARIWVAEFKYPIQSLEVTLRYNHILKGSANWHTYL